MTYSEGRNTMSGGTPFRWKTQDLSPEPPDFSVYFLITLTDREPSSLTWGNRSSSVSLTWVLPDLDAPKPLGGSPPQSSELSVFSYFIIKLHKWYFLPLKSATHINSCLPIMRCEARGIVFHSRAICCAAGDWSWGKQLLASAVTLLEKGCGGQWRDEKRGERFWK